MLLRGGFWGCALAPLFGAPPPARVQFWTPRSFCQLGSEPGLARSSDGLPLPRAVLSGRPLPVLCGDLQLTREARCPCGSCNAPVLPSPPTLGPDPQSCLPLQHGGPGVHRPEPADAQGGGDGAAGAVLQGAGGGAQGG